MTALRHRLPRLAALVLLVWLFATGVAFAQSCASTIQLDCIECCDEMKPTASFSEARTESAPPAAFAFALPPAALSAAPAWPQAAGRTAHWPDPPDRRGEDLTIQFLRLAL